MKPKTFRAEASFHFRLELLSFRGLYYAEGKKHFCNVWRLHSRDKEAYWWYSHKWESFFLSSEPVDDEGGDWSNVTVWARSSLVPQQYGPGAGGVFCP